MKITRTVDGEEYVFELTPDEMYSAFREQNMAYHKEDIIHFGFDDASEDALMNEWGMSKEQFDDRMDDIALELEEEIADLETDYLYPCIQNAIHRVLERSF